MSTNMTFLKFKVLGFGAAAVIGATMLLGPTNFATTATSLTCPQASTPLCYNEHDTRGEATGDFRGNDTWQDRLVPDHINNPENSAVPIPAALPLFGAALLGLVFLSRRRKKKALQA